MSEQEHKMRDALVTIRDIALGHQCCDQELFYERNVEALANIGGDVCDWTMIAIHADDGLKQ